MCKFSQSTGLFLLDLRHVLVIISLATCRVRNGLESLRFVTSLFLSTVEVATQLSFSVVGFPSFLEEIDILSCSILNLICFRIPTKSSSTLCSIPAEVSINLASQFLAKDLPSVKKRNMYYVHRYFLETNVYTSLLMFLLGAQLSTKVARPS